MFTVDEFSRLARVSKRLLRYYDELGVLKPNYNCVRLMRISYAPN